jgi:two-component system, NtrC family, response regulator AtoC
MLAQTGATVRGSSGLAPAPEAGDFSPARKKSPALRILVVDDEALIRWSLAETLIDSGYYVVEAPDGKGALAALGDAQAPIDVVLLDYRLPDSNDLTLLSTVRKLAPATQVILMTAYGTPEIFRGALELGAYRVVSKPFEMNELASLVEQAHSAHPC